MLSILNELTLQKELHSFMLIMIFGQKIKAHHKQQQNKKANIQILARAGMWTRKLSHPDLEWYLSATNTSECVEWSQAI